MSVEQETEGWIKVQYDTLKPGEKQTITFGGNMRWLYNHLRFNVGGNEYDRMYTHDMEGIFTFIIPETLAESCSVLVTLSIIAPDMERTLATKQARFSVTVPPKEAVTIPSAVFGVRNLSGGAAEQWELQDGALYCIRKMSDVVVTATFKAGYYHFGDLAISVGRYYKSFSIKYTSAGELDSIPASYDAVPEASRNSCVYGNKTQLTVRHVFEKVDIFGDEVRCYASSLDSAKRRVTTEDVTFEIASSTTGVDFPGPWTGKTLKVLDYSSPSIYDVKAYRSTDDCMPDDESNYVSASCSVNFYPLGGKNALEPVTSGGKVVKVEFRTVGDEAWTALGTQDVGVTQAYAVEFPTTEDPVVHEIQITVSDKLSTVSKVTTLSSGIYPIFFPAGGRGVSFGMIGNEQDAVQISADWKMYHGTGTAKRELTDAFLRSEIWTGTSEPSDSYVLPKGYLYLQLDTGE